MYHIVVYWWKESILGCLICFSWFRSSIDWLWEPHPLHYLIKETLKPVEYVIPYGNEKKPPKQNKRNPTKQNKKQDQLTKKSQQKNPKQNKNKNIPTQTKKYSELKPL